jgi:hypothetical protein
VNMRRRGFLTVSAAGLTVGLLPDTARAAPAASRTETVYLSGRDKDHPVDWEFMVASGRQSNTWSVIPTPSNWEFHGFGSYNYGFNLVPTEIGHYRHSFAVPASWRGRRTFLVFEAAMTDTQVWVNGRSAGPRHQGGFYRFRYEVTGLLRFGQSNLLEVEVSKESSDDSVNRAERMGDYWNFGGIYRPVYLQAHPAEFIDRLAVDARADGTFRVDAHLGGLHGEGVVLAQVRRLDGRPVGRPGTAPVGPDTEVVTVRTTVPAPRLWTAETPNLYLVDVRLLRGGRQVHETSSTFGFRTVEVRAGDGIYVNGRKVILKGANRHVFWPNSGRASSPTISRDDIALMKQMNMNAVRTSHYPPDTHFLDYCDKLGLYVLDELAGWQKSYDEAHAAPLVAEMVTRDVNHPSILFWDNGNEGGWNTAVDDDFGLYDPQQRKVLHPWAIFSDIDTDHYETYASTQAKLAGSTIFMSTEFLHGLYDGGTGAGLNDYWKLMGSERLAAGGFLWALLDEGVVRDDRGGAIDVVGNSAPDGILGPFREKEASFYTIKEIWSPIQVSDLDYFQRVFPTGFEGTVGISNHYAFTNTRQCSFGWELLRYPGPTEDRSGDRSGHRVLARGTVTSPDVAPGGTGTLDLRLPADWRRSDALALTVLDPSGQELYTWRWTITKAAGHASRIVTSGRGFATGAVDAAGITMAAGGTLVTIDPASGLLSQVTHRGLPFPLANGPSPATGTATLIDLTHGPDGDAYQITANYTGGLDRLQWRLHASGWLRLEYAYTLTGPHDFFGVNFDYPEAQVEGITWLGHGPRHVYKNRLRGVTPDVWSKEYNDTATGADTWQYPEFKGYHADTYWAVLRTTEGRLTAVTEDEGLYLRLFTPRRGVDPRFTAPPFPAGDISFLDAIPAMGTKFDPATNLGPESQPNIATGSYRRTVHFHFGPRS